jgi:hypothetical protein
LIRGLFFRKLYKIHKIDETYYKLQSLFLRKGHGTMFKKNLFICALLSISGLQLEAPSCLPSSDLSKMLQFAGAGLFTGGLGVFFSNDKPKDQAPPTQAAPPTQEDSNDNEQATPDEENNDEANGNNQIEIENRLYRSPEMIIAEAQAKVGKNRLYRTLEVITADKEAAAEALSKQNNRRLGMKTMAAGTLAFLASQAILPNKNFKEGWTAITYLARNAGWAYFENSSPFRSAIVNFTGAATRLGITT